MSDDPLLTPVEVAQQLKFTVRTVYALVRSGELPAIKLGHRSMRIRQSAVDTLLEAGVKNAIS